MKTLYHAGHGLTSIAEKRHRNDAGNNEVAQKKFTSKPYSLTLRFENQKLNGKPRDDTPDTFSVSLRWQVTNMDKDERMPNAISACA